MNTSGADGLQVGFAFADEPTLTPAPGQKLDSTPIWLLHRAGGWRHGIFDRLVDDTLPAGKRLIMGMEWKGAGIERRTNVTIWSVLAT